MEFQTETQKKVYDKVAQILRDEFGKTATARDDSPSFVMRNGSAYVQVTVTADQRAAHHVSARTPGS